MATHIKQIDSSTYEVNGKRVIKDMDERWTTQNEGLSNQESRDFSLHLVKIAQHED
jgi:hypothetical protein